MAVVRHEVTLNASPKRVWEFVTALRFLPLWIARGGSVRAVSTPHAEPGTTYEVVRSGRAGVERWIVAEYDPPRRLRLVEYHRDFEIVLLLEAAGADTRLIAQEKRPNRLGVVGRLIGSGAQEQVLALGLERLRELVLLNQDIKLLHGMGDE